MSADHDHAPDRMTRAFAIGMALNVVFVIAEAIAGVLAQSTALLADAAHNLSDVLGLGMAWGATILARRARTPRRTYGLRRTTILAALANGGLVLVAVGAVAWEAIHELGAPRLVQGSLVAGVAALGVVVNLGAALLFARDRARDVNVRGAYLHLVADAAVSAGVVISGVLVWWTGRAWIDPAASLIVSLVILRGTWALLREALDLLLDAVPAHLDPRAIEAFLAAAPGVTSIHDLHIWSMSTTEAALTAHLVLAANTDAAPLLHQLSTDLARRFALHHVTLQPDSPASSAACAAASC